MNPNTYMKPAQSATTSTTTRFASTLKKYITMKKFYIMTVLMLISLASFAQVPSNDQCGAATALTICNGTGFNLERNSQALTNDGNYSGACSGGAIQHGVWYKFRSFMGGNASLAIKNINIGNTPGLVLRTETYIGNCGALVPVASSCKTGNTSIVTTLNLLPDTVYYVVVGIESPANPAVSTFSINISNISVDAVISKPVADISFNPPFPVICENSPDSIFTFKNTTVTHGGKAIKYFISVGDPGAAKKGYIGGAVGDTSINLVKTARMLMKDSLDVCFYALNECSGLTDQKCQRFFVQKLDAKFAATPHNKCGQDPITFKVVFPLKAPIPPTTDNYLDTATINSYTWKVVTPCETVTQTVLSPGGVSTFTYTPKCGNAIGDYQMTTTVYVDGQCGPIYAYDARVGGAADFTKFQDLTTRKLSYVDTIFTTPSVAPKYSKDDVTYTSLRDTACAGLDYYIKLPRLTKRGHGAFIYNVTTHAGSTGTATATAIDSVFKITGLPIPTGTTFATSVFDIHVTDGFTCTGDTTATVVVRPKVMADGQIYGPQTSGKSAQICLSGTFDFDATQTSGITTNAKYNWTSLPANRIAAGQDVTNGTAQSKPLVLADGNTKFYLQITDEAGCLSPKDSVDGFILAPPVVTASITAGLDSICKGNSNSVPVKATITGGGTTTSISWTANPTGPTYAPLGNANTTFTNVREATVFTVTVGDAIGCTGSASVTAHEARTPTLVVTKPTANCERDLGKTATFDIRNVTGNPQFIWTVPSPFTPTSVPTTKKKQVFTIPNGTVAGKYPVTINIKYPATMNVCDTLLTDTIVVLPSPHAVLAFAPSSSVCPGTSVTISVSDATDPGNVNVYGAPSPLPNTQIYNTTSSVILHVDRGVCKQDTTYQVTVFPTPAAPTLTAPVLSVCEHDSRTYTVAAPVATSTYTWTIKAPAGTPTPPTPLSGTGSSITITDWGTALGPNTVAKDTIIVFETSTNGCVGLVNKYVVDVNPVPVTAPLTGFTTASGNDYNDNELCAGSSRKYKVQGADPASTFTWTIGNGTPSPLSTGDSINVVWPLNPGTGSVSYKETRSSAGCNAVSPVLIVTIDTIPTITITSQPSSLCEGTIYANLYNTKKLYHAKYDWTVASGSQNIEPGSITGNGTNTIGLRTVTPPNPVNVQFTINLSDTVTGCKALPLTTNAIPVNRNPQVTISKTAFPKRTVCVGSTVTLPGQDYFSEAGGVLWTDVVLSGAPTVKGTFVNSGMATTDYTFGSTPGDIVLYLTVKDAPCNSVQDSLLFHVLAMPTITSITPSVIADHCQGDPVALVGTANAATGYTWTATNVNNFTGAFFNGITPNNKIPNPTYQPGTAEYGLTTLSLVVDNGGICPASAPTSVTVNFILQPVAKITPIPAADANVCADGSTLQLHRSPSAGTVVWSIASGPGTIDQTNSVDPTYTAPTILGVASQDVTVTCTISNAPCASSSSSVTFKVLAMPKLSTPITLSSSPSGTPTITAICEGSIDPVYIIGGTEVYTTKRFWTVETNGGVKLPNTAANKYFSDSTAINPVFYPNVNIKTNYNLILHYFNGECAQIEQVPLNVNLKSTANINQPYDVLGTNPLIQSSDNRYFIRCQGEPLDLPSNTVTFPLAKVTPMVPAQIKWTATTSAGVTTTGTFTSGGAIQNPSYTFGPNETDTTVIKLEVLNPPCDPASTSIKIYTTPRPSIGITTTPTVTPLTPLCRGTILQLNGSVAGGPLPGDAYSWAASPSGILFNDPFIANPTHGPTVTTTYTVTVTSRMCSAVETKVINVIDKPVLTTTTPKICVGNPVEGLKVDLSPGTSQGQWSTFPASVGGVFSPNVNALKATYQPSEDDTINQGVKLIFTITGNEVTNCPATGTNPLADTLDIVIRRSSLLTVGPVKSDSVNQGQYVNLSGYKVYNTANVDQPSSFGYWKSEGSGKFLDAAGLVDVVTPKIYVPSDEDFALGKFNLTYYLSADNCNQGNAVLKIKVNAIKVPTIFTPDGDGINDTFTINGIPENVHLKVFDRWGKLVYEKEVYDNTWDAHDVPEGTYYYIATYRLGSQHGWIQLLKK